MLGKLGLVMCACRHQRTRFGGRELPSSSTRVYKSLMSLMSASITDASCVL